MNRRKFFASSVAAAISAAAAGHAGMIAMDRARAAGTGTSTPSMRLYKFIYDDRFAAARVFGAAGEHGYSSAGAAAIHGDVTALWSNELRGEWQAGGGAIAGMTTARSLFCLEELAKDHWMRVVLRVDHFISAALNVEHRLTAPEVLVARMRSALSAADWPAQLPGVLSFCPHRDGPARPAGVLASPGSGCWTAAAPELVSFVIA